MQCNLRRLNFTLRSCQVDHTDQSHAALLRFNNLWASEYAHNSTLVFSTGRSVAKYKELRSQAPLLTPNIGIFSVGTEIRYGESMVPDQDWESFLDDGWNQAVVLEEVNRLNLRLQVFDMQLCGFCQKNPPVSVSY